MRFRNRYDAGQALAAMLLAYSDRSDVLVLALPRGGVPVGYEVARALHAPLDVFLVRKLGVPGREELAMGAIASGGVRVLNQDVISYLHIPVDVIDAVAAREIRELHRREQMYRGDLPQPAMLDRQIIVVDDGLATGSSMRAAVSALSERHPSRIVVAVPVGAPETCNQLRYEVAEVVCLATPVEFSAVSGFYDDFSQTTDEEVRHLLELAARQRQAPSQVVH